jgi:O-antigen/teichoic acid export membrane protein
VCSSDLLGAAGLLINVVVARLRGAAALGVFNQIYGYFVVASQLAVGGVHHSALKHVAQTEDQRERRVVAASSLLVAGLLGLAVSLAFAGLAGLAENVLNSPEVGRGLLWAAPGLFFFSLNKTAMSLLNGLRRMRAFAVMQGLRFLLLLGLVCLVAARDWPDHVFGGCFTAGELLLSLVLAPCLARACPPRLGEDTWGWMARHAWFGARGMFSGLLLEANLRVDILVLGWFVSDYLVGLYSLAATFAEGFYNLFHVVRVNVNPLLVEMLASGDQERLRETVGRIRRRTYLAAAAGALLLLAGFPLFLWLFFEDPGLLEAWPALAILTLGLVAYSGYLPVDFILLQGGQPGVHTLYMIMQVGTNAAPNLALAPLLGIQGAALATALSFGVSVFYLRWLVRRQLRIAL